MFSIPEVEELLANRQIGPLQGFRAKTGFPFAAVLKITENPETGGLHMVFDFGQSKEEEAEMPDFTDKTPVGICPKCKGSVYETDKAYLCEHSIGKDKSCTFRSGHTILQQEISPEQMKKLLSEGKTDLLTGFISNRTNRPFKAYLELGRGGKINFQFEEPTGKTAARKSTSAKHATAETGTAVATVEKRSEKKAPAAAKTKATRKKAGTASK